MSADAVPTGRKVVSYVLTSVPSPPNAGMVLARFATCHRAGPALHKDAPTRCRDADMPAPQPRADMDRDLDRCRRPRARPGPGRPSVTRSSDDAGSGVGK